MLVVGQSSVLRCLIAYLQVSAPRRHAPARRSDHTQGLKPNEIPAISVREGELIVLSPQAYGTAMEKLECVASR